MICDAVLLLVVCYCSGMYELPCCATASNACYTTSCLQVTSGLHLIGLQRAGEKKTKNVI